MGYSATNGTHVREVPSLLESREFPRNLVSGLCEDIRSTNGSKFQTCHIRTVALFFGVL